MTGPATYHADIRASDPRDGTFIAELRKHPISVRSANAEYDLCFAMVRAGLPDVELQFWRGNTPTLRFKSVHRAAQFRISLGNEFPRRVERRSGQTPFGGVGQVAQDGQFDAGRYPTAPQVTPACLSDRAARAVRP